nr:aromatic-ring-hydroxylating dioxygenase subunit beta [Novosphingobium hassiacum]
MEIGAQVDALQAAYAYALDGRNMQAWLDCFGQEAGYVLTSRENDDAGLPVGMIMDDNHARLRDRVKFVTDIWTGTFEDYPTRHFIQRLHMDWLADGVLAVHSNFLVSYVSTTGKLELLASGFYRDEIVIAPKCTFRSKRAILDGEVAPRYLVYPI